MKLIQLDISYTVESGTSGDYHAFDVKDTIFIYANNPILSQEGGLEKLRDLLLDSSVRGGGYGAAIYENAVLEVHPAKRYGQEYPSHRETGAAFYQTSIDPAGVTAAHALSLYTIKQTEIASDIESLKKTEHDLVKQINKTQSLNRRYTSSEKLRSLRLKAERAEQARIRLLSDNSRTFSSIKSSPEYEAIEKRKADTLKKLDHLTTMKARYSADLGALRTERDTVRAAARQVEKQEREFEREVEKRFKIASREMGERHRLYRIGQTPSTPKDLGKTPQKLRAEIAETVKHEIRMKTDPEYRERNIEIERIAADRRREAAERRAESLYRASQNVAPTRDRQK